MIDNRVVYRVRDWLGDSCIRDMYEDVESGILKSVEDCVRFAKGYCKASGCVPIEVITHILALADSGAVA